jgi:hypothetical protein
MRPTPVPLTGTGLMDLLTLVLVLVRRQRPHQPRSSPSGTRTSSCPDSPYIEHLTEQRLVRCNEFTCVLLGFTDGVALSFLLGY